MNSSLLFSSGTAHKTTSSQVHCYTVRPCLSMQPRYFVEQIGGRRIIEPFSVNFCVLFPAHAGLLLKEGVRRLSMVKTTQGYVFGGYTDIAWNSQTEWGQYESSKTFIFALQSHGLRSESYRAFPKDDKHYYTVCHNPSYLFTFGGGCDLCIADESNSASGSYSNWGHTYDRPSSTTSNEWLNGQKNFQTVEIEVFAM
eukprot:m.161281 g.161281  ORF g.161281 m.161281 type:complete len:198 (+) comp38813_c1_seq1:1057-1650(+)